MSSRFPQFPCEKYRWNIFSAEAEYWHLIIFRLDMPFVTAHIINCQTFVNSHTPRKNTRQPLRNTYMNICIHVRVRHRADRLHTKRAYIFKFYTTRVRLSCSGKSTWFCRCDSREKIFRNGYRLMVVAYKLPRSNLERFTSQLLFYF